MRSTWNGFSRDGNEEFRLAQAAYEGESLLGLVLLSRCYLYGYGVDKDAEMAGKYLRKALDSKHPLALNYLANCLEKGSGGFPRNTAKSLKIRQDAISQGSVMAAENHCLMLYQGGRGFKKNPEAAVAYAAARLRTNSEGKMFSDILLRAIRDGVTHPALKDAKLLANAERRTRLAARHGDFDSMSRLAGYLAKAGRPHEAVPLMLKSARAENSNSLGMLVSMSDGDYFSRRFKSAAQFSTEYQLARMALEAGNDSIFLSTKVASSYLFDWGGGEAQPEKALPLLKKQLKRGRRVHQLLGRNYLFFDFPDHDAARGEAHYIYSRASRGADSLSRMAEGYVRAPEQSRNLAKARAATTAALVHLKEGVYQNKAKHLLDKINAEITPKERAQSEELLKSGWPLSQETMDQAVATLIEYRDLPKGARVPQVKEE